MGADGFPRHKFASRGFVRCGPKSASQVGGIVSSLARLYVRLTSPIRAAEHAAAPDTGAGQTVVCILPRVPAAEEESHNPGRGGSSPNQLHRSRRRTAAPLVHNSAYMLRAGCVTNLFTPGSCMLYDVSAGVEHEREGLGCTQ